MVEECCNSFYMIINKLALIENKAIFISSRNEWDIECWIFVIVCSVIPQECYLVSKKWRAKNGQQKNLNFMPKTYDSLKNAYYCKILQ